MATTAYFLNQYISTTLASVGGIDASQTTGIILASITNIDTTKPGIACLSYTDPLSTATAEWITYTSIDSGTKELQGVTRGQEGYAAKAHSNGVTVAFPLSESHINNLNTALMIGGSATNLTEGVLDEDDMASNSATKVPTQQSVKAYSDSATQTLTNKTLTSPLFRGSIDGWVSANETWTRIGDFTFTVAGDLTAKYRKGAKVRYKDGGAFEYGYVISSSYSNPNTTVTLATNSDYAMAAATITEPAISYVDNPEGFPQWFNVVLTVYGSSTAGAATYTTQKGRFTLHGHTCIFSAYLVWTAHTGSGDMKVSIPLACKNIVSYFAQIMTGYLSSMTFPASTVQVGGYADPNGTKVNITAIRDGAGATTVILDTAANLMYSGSYEIE